MTYIFFKDYPDFTPNITPNDMFREGIMGGYYFRVIKSPLTGKVYNKQYIKYNRIFNKIPKEKYRSQIYNKDINKYKVSCGTSYEYWISKGWINEKYDPFGWIEWYINFYYGRRCDDDIRQIKRWQRIAGNNGRFYKMLKNKINKSNKINKIDINILSKDIRVFPVLKQTLLHWGVDWQKV